jgi:hypothetical protein
VKATASLKQRMRRTTAVLQMLDRLVRSELAANEPALAEWASTLRASSEDSV